MNTPMLDENGNPLPGVGAENVQAAGTVKQPEQPVAGIVKDLGAELSQGAQASQKKDEPIAAQPMLVDLSKLTGDDLVRLKQMLNATPDRSLKKKVSPIVQMRELDGKVILSYKRAYLGIVRDLETRADVERHIIPVLVQGATEYKNIMYSEFMELPRVKCEIVSQRKEEDDIVEGETVSAETGRLVEMTTHVVTYFFTIKLPDGSTIEVPGEMVNS